MLFRSPPEIALELLGLQEFAGAFQHDVAAEVAPRDRVGCRPFAEAHVPAADGQATLTVDLEKQEIRGPDGGCIKFDIDAFRKHCLVNGLDDIGLTLQKGAKIDAYEARLKQSQPWIAA